jgi:hypothetical protein
MSAAGEHSLSVKLSLRGYFPVGEYRRKGETAVGREPFAVQKLSLRGYFPVGEYRRKGETAVGREPFAVQLGPLLPRVQPEMPPASAFKMAD